MKKSSSNQPKQKVTFVSEMEFPQGGACVKLKMSSKALAILNARSLNAGCSIEELIAQKIMNEKKDQ